MSSIQIFILLGVLFIIPVRSQGTHTCTCKIHVHVREMAKTPISPSSSVDRHNSNLLKYLSSFLHKSASFWLAQCLSPKKRKTEMQGPLHFLPVVRHFYFVHARLESVSVASFVLRGSIPTLHCPYLLKCFISFPPRTSFSSPLSCTLSMGVALSCIFYNDFWWKALCWPKKADLCRNDGIYT